MRTLWSEDLEYRLWRDIHTTCSCSSLGAWLVSAACGTRLPQINYGYPQIPITSPETDTKFVCHTPKFLKLQGINGFILAYAWFPLSWCCVMQQSWEKTQEWPWCLLHFELSHVALSLGIIWVQKSLWGEEWREKRKLIILQFAMLIELPAWCPATWSDVLWTRLAFPKWCQVFPCRLPVSFSHKMSAEKEIISLACTILLACEQTVSGISDLMGSKSQNWNSCRAEDEFLPHVKSLV